MRQTVGCWRLVTPILALSLTASACNSTATVVDDQITPAATTPTTFAPETVSTTTLPNQTATTTTGPLISLDGTECTSSIPETWSGGALEFEIENKNTITMAVVMGTYHDGYEHADLVAYGRDITPRPDFIDALEIYEVGPQTTRLVSFDYGPGQYFTTCLDSTSTMIVLDDVTVRN
ncbi:MAG: hypothetical protein HKN03_12415 [Acidimicrobiales bacterium]|nr:hypothetical protein [Acidimicrobiales bacterium]